MVAGSWAKNHKKTQHTGRSISCLAAIFWNFYFNFFPLWELPLKWQPIHLHSWLLKENQTVPLSKHLLFKMWWACWEIHGNNLRYDVSNSLCRRGSTLRIHNLWWGFIGLLWVFLYSEITLKTHHIIQADQEAIAHFLRALKVSSTCLKGNTFYSYCFPHLNLAQFLGDHLTCNFSKQIEVCVCDLKQHFSSQET